MFSDVLLTVDFDRTLTAPDSTIPVRNLEAIEYFMANGGTFTVNTGRSANTFRKYLHTLPRNAPLLLYNGSAAYDNGSLTDCKVIDLPLWETVMAVAEAFPELNVEIQAVDTHYLVNEKPDFAALYDALGWGHKTAIPGSDVGPFIKFAIFGKVHEYTLNRMFQATEAEIARFQELTEFIASRWGDKVELFLASPRILDIHAKGVSKCAAARDLQKKLGKKILVCVGDAANDISMLDGADYAYCPADGSVADRYETVCNCAEGAVADVIYKKIPQILQIHP